MVMSRRGNGIRCKNNQRMLLVSFAQAQYYFEN